MKQIALFIMLVAFAQVSFGQDEAKMLEALQVKPSIEVKQTSTKFQKENRPAFTAYINANPDEVGKAWEQYVHDKCQCDFKKKKGVYSAVAIKLPEITVETISLFSTIEEDEKGARLDVFVDLGVAFMNTKNNPEESAKMEAMISHFVRGFYVGWYDEVLKDQRKLAEKTTKEYEKVLKEGEKLTKEISKNSETIQKSEADITKAEKEIVDLQAKMDELRGTIEQSKSQIISLEKQVEDNTKLAASEKAKVEAQSQVVERLKANADAIRTGK